MFESLVLCLPSIEALKKDWSLLASLGMDTATNTINRHATSYSFSVNSEIYNKQDVIFNLCHMYTHTDRPKHLTWLWGDNPVNIQDRFIVFVHCPFPHCYLSINQVSFLSL